LYVKENSFVNGSSSVIGNLSIGKLHDGSSSVDIYNNNKNQFGLYLYSNKPWASDTYGIYSRTLNGTGSSSGNVYGLYSSVAGSTGKKWAGYFKGGDVEVSEGNLKVNGNSLLQGNVGIGTTPSTEKLSVAGRFTIAPSGTSPDNGYCGNIVITKPAASGQYINLIRAAQHPWSIGTVYNTSKFAIGTGVINDANFTNPYFVIAQETGNVGIGTTTPGYKLDVAGSARVNSQLIINGSGQEGVSLNILNSSKTGAGEASRWAIYNMCGTYGNSLQFWAYDNTGCPGGLCNSRLTLMDDGKVGIGTSVIPSDYKLAVAGKIIAEEVVVKLQSAGWPDYVFDQNYLLKPLLEVEQFVKTNKHLPGIPSASQVEEKGLSMGEMQNKLLQKIEELTLYIIEQQKQIDELKKQVVK
jgi:hypothetical protein